MNSQEISLDLPTLSVPPARLPSPARSVLTLLGALRDGALAVELPDTPPLRLGSGELRAHMQVHDLEVFARTLAEGDIGFAESYIDGQWDSDKLPELLTLLADNRATLARAVHGQWWPLLRHKLVHWARINTRAGARRNILAHYDLGNEFYRRWLDPSMSYSSALFSAPDMTLEQAQHAKYRRILDQLDAQPGQTVLEIGCGWGGFAELAVRERGLRVHGITLSPAQLAYARERAQAGGWAEHAHFELRDYRDLSERFDHIVSIEMFEAVGERFWPGYFRQLAQCLMPGGRAVVQTITIANERFAAYRRGTDFIQRHIFPGGMLPSPEVFERRLASADFGVRDRFAFGRDYGRTLAHWHRNVEAAWPQIAALGFDERFHRLWRFYLSYCEAGFRSGATDVYQYCLERR